MRMFNYSKFKEYMWDSEILGYVAAIYKEVGKQELYLKQRPEELEKLVEIAKIQSTEASMQFQFPKITLVSLILMSIQKSSSLHLLRTKHRKP